MEKMYRLAFIALLGTLAFAQTDAPQADKPPAGVDQALLKRVNELFTMFMKQDYRKAESWIAEDTKDYYYGGSKPEIRKFEVMSVEFSDHFTHAKAIVRVTEPVVIAGFPPGDMTVNLPTLWKLENGDWCFYEDPDKIGNPSGLRTKVQAAVDTAAAAGAAAGGAVPPPQAMLANLPQDPSFTLGRLQVDKPNIKLAPGAEERITISNGLPGPVSLELGAPLPGIEAKLDRADVARGEKATLTLKAGKEPGSGTYYLRIMPTGEALAIQVQAK
jgi:hypothetical protein